MRRLLAAGLALAVVISTGATSYALWRCSYDLVARRACCCPEAATNDPTPAEQATASGACCCTVETVEVARPPSETTRFDPLGAPVAVAVLVPVRGSILPAPPQLRARLTFERPPPLTSSLPLLKGALLI